MKYKDLRKKYPKFIYEKYHWKISKDNLEIFFTFSVPPDISFRPKIIIENVDKKRLARIGLPAQARRAKAGESALNNLVFHLGLMEIPSYWKTTCSPEIEIKAGFLNKEQIRFWKDLIIKGLGQFFYENKINFRKPGFLTILPKKAIADFMSFGKELKLNQNRYLVPVGGGKDAIVTLELLKKQKKLINAFLVNPVRNSPPHRPFGRASAGVISNGVNPTRVAKEVIQAAGIKNPIIVRRQIDPALLNLNKRGFLNGHTPFTAVLSFLAVFCGVLFDYKNVVFSNEKSADEGNVKYLGKMINHQWSKSSEFERKFRTYCKKYLASGINYSSLLRPYTELEISKMFLKYPRYFPVFSSCNNGMRIIKTKPASARGFGVARWCGNCPKCLFVYAAFYPFLEKKELLKIFDRPRTRTSSSVRGRDIFENRKLLPIMKALLEKGRVKPFECVGTKKESRLAFSFCLKKAKKNGEIPYLLTKLT